MWKKLKGPDGKPCLMKVDDGSSRKQPISKVAESPQQRRATKEQLIAALREGIKEALKPLEKPEEPVQATVGDPEYPRRRHTVVKGEDGIFKGVLLKTPIHQKHPAEPAPPGVFTGCLGDIRQSAQDPAVKGLHNVLPKTGQRLKAEPAPRASFTGAILPRKLAGTNNVLACGEFRGRDRRSKAERFAKSESAPAEMMQDNARAAMAQEARLDYEKRTGRKLKAASEISEETARIRFVPDGLY